MPRGRKPRTSVDPREPRMITWRLPGALHAKLVEVTDKHRLSINRLITETMRKRVEELDNLQSMHEEEDLDDYTVHPDAVDYDEYTMADDEEE